MHMETKKIMASIVEKTKHNGIVNVKIDGNMKVQFIHSENLHHTRIWIKKQQIFNYGGR